MAKTIIELINPKFDGKIKIYSFLTSFYLKRGYHKFSKNLAIRLYLKLKSKYLRKLILIINLIKNSSFVFKNFPSSEIIIYDCEDAKDLKSIISNYKVNILSTRLNKIKKIYISKNIFYYLLINFFKRSFKQNYIASLVISAKPKLVITNVDNSRDFHLTSKYLRIQK